MDTILVFQIAGTIGGLLLMMMISGFLSGGKKAQNELILVALASEFVALCMVAFDPGWEDFATMSIMCVLIGTSGYTGTRLVRRLLSGRKAGFLLREALEALGLFAGALTGMTAASVLLHYAVGQSFIWVLEGFAGIFNGIIILLVVSVSLVVAVVRLFYHFKLRADDARLQEQTFELLRVKEEQVSAQLQSIRARINPHFLYNALNAASEMVYSDPARAEKMLTALSRFFRAALEAGDDRFGTVAQEVELVRTYLSIEEARFGERLHYSIDVDAAAAGERIPRFLLQPLVENAVKHGIAHCEAGGHVDLHVHKVGKQLQVAVADNGPDFPQDLVGGYGWDSVQRSLSLLYPDRHEIRLKNGPEKQVQLLLDQA